MPIGRSINMEIIEKINEFVAGIAPGMKTLLSTLVMTVVSLYASTKGFSAEELQAWIEQGLVHVNTVIVLLGTITAWFRQLGKITDKQA